MFWIIFAHLIGDNPLQTDWMVKEKKKNWLVMLMHCIIWTGCICIALKYLEIPITFWKFWFLIIGHWIVDYCKTHQHQLQHPLSKNEAFYADQGLHLIQCFIVWIF